MKTDNIIDDIIIRRQEVRKIFIVIIVANAIVNGFITGLMDRKKNN